MTTTQQNQTTESYEGPERYTVSIFGVTSPQPTDLILLATDYLEPALNLYRSLTKSSLKRGALYSAVRLHDHNHELDREYYSFPA